MVGIVENVKCDTAELDSKYLTCVPVQSPALI
jgi:hypothetical protein